MIKAVIFDMNGVIINDEAIHEGLFQETLRPYGLKFNHQAYLSCCAGKTDRAGYQTISQKYRLKLPINRLVSEKNQKYQVLFSRHHQAYPGVINLIKNLAANFTLALTSGAIRQEVELVLKQFKLKPYFKVMITGDDVRKSKPDPEAYLKTVRLLGLQAKECLVLEDSANGVASAKAAGCYCLAITTTQSAAKLEKADKIVKSFEEITLSLIQTLH